MDHTYVLHSSVNTFRLIPHLALVNNSVMLIGVQISLQTIISFPLDIYPEVKPLLHYYAFSSPLCIYRHILFLFSILLILFPSPDVSRI